MSCELESKASHECAKEGMLHLNSLGLFKFWKIQKPNAAKLLKEVIFRWRGASGYVRNKPGIWVVWPRERWCEWTGLSRNQLDRALKELAESNLINRERHRFAGSEVRTFLQPTVIALKYLGRPHDLERLGWSSEDFIEKRAKKITAKTSDKVSEKINENTDYTSIPSSPIKSTSSTFAILAQEGNAGDDELDKLFAVHLVKKQKAADKLYPKIPGSHEKYVKHPSEIFQKWLSFSTELKDKWYQTYLTYVDNWNKGKKGKQYLDTTAEDDAAFLAAMQKLCEA